MTVGAVSVLLLILRTSMEDTVAKKYSPMCALYPSVRSLTPPKNSHMHHLSGQGVSLQDGNLCAWMP